MSKADPDPNKSPPHTWLPKVILTFLVFLVLVFVVYQTTVGLGERDLGDRSMWVLIVALVLLVLLPVVDRIQTISVSPAGFEAQLSQVQAEALETVGALVDDPEAAEKAREQIMQAKSSDQVQAAVDELVELNITRALEAVTDAIQEKRKCYVRYRPVPDEPLQTYYVAPLDIKPGKTPATKTHDYLWAHSYEHSSTVQLRLDRLVGVEPSEETFEPAEIMADWKNEQPEWNIARDWQYDG